MVSRFEQSIVLAVAAAFVLVCAIAAPTAQSAPTSEATIVRVPFSSNGCSGFREARFFTCCFVHDFDFWAGGNRTDRGRADKTLWRCLLDISHEHIVADIGYLLIRLELIPGMIVNDGWGRAWTGTGRTRFESLSVEQQQTVATEKQRVCRGLTLNPATGNYSIDPGLLRSDRRELRASQARAFCGFAPPSR